MYKIQGVIPISQFDSNGIEFTQDFYRYITTHSIDLLFCYKKKRGRGYTTEINPIGTVKMAVRHRVLMFEGEVDAKEPLPPYLRLCYSYRENKIAEETVGLIFSDQPGVLSESNYKVIEVK